MTSRKYRRLTSVASVLAILALPALSQTVTIQTVDGNISIQGRIMGFDGENYDLDSAIGRTTIPAAAVVCIGEACPVIEDESGLTGALAVLDRPSMAIFNELIDSYVANRDLSMEREGGDALSTTALNFTDDENEEAGRLEITASSQEESFRALVSGEQKFVLSTAPIEDALAEQLASEGFPDLRDPGREVIVALDAVVPVVHPTNNTRDISLPVMARIAAGRIQNWSDLGGPDLPIRIVLPEDESSISKVFDERVMRPNRLRLNRRLERVANEAEAAAIVKSDPAAISLVSNALAEETKRLPIRQVCGPLSLASDFSVKAEEYPLARRVLVYTSGEALSEGLKDLLSYAGSADAQAEYLEAGFVGQTVETVPMSLHGSRLASAILAAETPEEFSVTRQLTQELTQADRISTTFRFEAGSTELDNKSRRDAVRIASYLMQPENADREILLFGFTDSVGRDDLNRLLSLQQAERISQAIIDASTGQISRDRISVTSYGSIAPVGCNDTVEGRNSNRRVEVWIR
ncbi:MAG: phosphate ABC transporter substrate-binding/OmpA family protein [Pseudomonadota bacterium]